jgi:hypothetical protein
MCALGLMALILQPVKSYALSVSGYVNAEYNHFQLEHESADPQQKPPYGGFDVQRVGIVFQHEADIFKSYAQIQFLHAPEYAEDGDGKGANSGKPITFGEVALEKAYIEARISKAFHMKIGKEITPTLWQRALYPSLYESITIPQMVETVFHEYIVGAIASGELPYGFLYDAWLQNADNKYETTKSDHKKVTDIKKPRPSQGMRFGWDNESMNYSTYFGVLGAKYSDNELGQNVYGYETSITYKHFSFWGEFNKGKVTQGYYILPSYSIPISDESDISPYILLDFFRNYNVGPDTRKVHAIGLNYRPNSYLTAKAEYVKTSHSNTEA